MVLEISGKSMIRMRASFLCSARAKSNAVSGDQSFTRLSSKSVAAPQLRSECAAKTRLQSAAAQNSVIIMDSFMRVE